MTPDRAGGLRSGSSAGCRGSPCSAPVPWPDADLSRPQESRDQLSRLGRSGSAPQCSRGHPGTLRISSGHSPNSGHACRLRLFLPQLSRGCERYPPRPLHAPPGRPFPPPSPIRRRPLAPILPNQYGRTGEIKGVRNL